jgi:hypothetical protein
MRAHEVRLFRCSTDSYLTVTVNVWHDEKHSLEESVIFSSQQIATIVESLYEGWEVISHVEISNV